MSNRFSKIPTKFKRIYQRSSIEQQHNRRWIWRQGWFYRNIQCRRSWRKYCRLVYLRHSIKSYRLPNTGYRSCKNFNSGKTDLYFLADEPAQGVLHLGFKLSKDGESLTLSKQNYLGDGCSRSGFGTILEQNLSYSRIPDGGATWKIVHPTYNLANIDFSSTDNHYASARLTQLWSPIIWQ